MYEKYDNAQYLTPSPLITITFPQPAPRFLTLPHHSENAPISTGKKSMPNLPHLPSLKNLGRCGKGNAADNLEMDFM